MITTTTTVYSYFHNDSSSSITFLPFFCVVLVKNCKQRWDSFVHVSREIACQLICEKYLTIIYNVLNLNLFDVNKNILDVIR